ncbi:MAG TPA: hypothetical protein VGA07_10400 [Anaerolineales bacterium]
MSEQRCPMCSRPNSPDADECWHCGARLTPLDPGGPASGSGSQPGSRRGGERQQVPPEQDWLDRIRAESEAAGEPEPELTAEPEAGELPSWLEEIKPKGTTPEAGAEGGRVSAFKAAGEPGGMEAADESGPPEWLRRIRAREEERAQDTGESGQDWLSGLRGSPGAEPEPEDIPYSPRPGRDMAAPKPAAPESPDLPPERPRGRPAAASQEAMPSWLRQAGGQDAPPGQDRAAEQLPPSGSPPTTPPFGLPHVQALIGEGGAGEAPPGGKPEGEVGLPDWMDAASLEGPAESLPAAAEGEDSRLAPATLPSWLEAMRPVETFRPVVQIQTEDDQAVESAGPLAGLRGVLIAEPLVAMPRTATVGSMQLAVSERQYAQAELLHRMVEEEGREVQASRRARPQLHFIRWAVAGVLLFATALPVLTGSPRFSLPSLEPRELGSLFTLIDTLPAERPALLVFDYEPGYSGELDAVGEALIEQIMVRGMPIATMTTRPTGSPLAMRVIDRLAPRHGYLPGEEVVHLGYLSGGPTAVQLFSLRPREAILQGFGLPEDMQEAGITAWDTPVLRGVAALSDFSLVTVITAGTETARIWAEQAKNSMGQTPLVMVLSAGAEPMVRPYYEAREPRVNGILTGLPAATAYERRMGQEGLAAQRWNAFGTAMLASEFILAAGIAYGLVQWWMARQER